KAPFGLCNRYSMKVRWPQNTNPADSDRAETAAIALTASDTSAPVPPCRAGTPILNKLAAASFGRRRDAPSDFRSRSRAMLSSHRPKSAGRTASMMALIAYSAASAGAGFHAYGASSGLSAGRPRLLLKLHKVA